ncbi:MAG: hypothetical protein ACLFQB_15280 [Chitinispirillaceae bacterium]
MRTKKSLFNVLLHLSILLLGFTAILTRADAQTAEVTRSGSTWTTRIAERSVYSGSSLGDAIRDASSELGRGTINIRNTGDLRGRISPRADQTFDFHENEMTGRNFEGFQAKHTNGITIRNFHLRDGARSISFHGCSDVHLHNIVLLLNSGNGVRIDNDRYSNAVRTTNLKVTGGIRIEGARGHAFETYTVDGIEIDRFIARNNGYCGLILNDSRNAEIGYIHSYRSPRSGGYAGFRTANGNGPSINVDTLITEECGRGYFSVSKSRGTTISYVNISGSTTHGMLIQNAEDVHIRSGVVWNNNCAEAIRFSTDAGSAGGYMDCRNNIIENVRIFDDRGSNRQQTYGIRESSDGGRTGRNIVRNCDLRNAGSNRSNDLVLDGAGSESIGNALTGDSALLPDDGTIIIEPEDPIDRGSGDHLQNLTLLETANGDNWNIMNTLGVGQTSFGDRDYTFASIPDHLTGSEWIQTAMDSRTNTSLESYAALTAGTDGYLFIAHSDRIESKPQWLSQYEKTDATITVQENEETERTLTLYRKAVSPGDEIELGINSDDGTTQSLMYIPIMVAEQTVKIISNNRKESDLAIRTASNSIGATAQISYFLHKDSHIRIDLYSMNGKPVKLLEEGRKRTGHHTISFERSKLPNSIYFLRIKAGNEYYQQRLLQLR